MESSSAIITAQQLAQANPKDLNLHSSNLQEFLKGLRNGGNLISDESKPPIGNNSRRNVIKSANCVNEEESDLQRNFGINLNQLAQIA